MCLTERAGLLFMKPFSFLTQPDVPEADFWIALLRVHIQELLLFSLIGLDPNNSQSGCECASSAAEELCAPGSEYVAQGELHEARRG